MKKQNRPTVYLSYSLQDKSTQFQEVKSVLERAGFQVVHYNKGENYNDAKLRGADFAVFLTNTGYDEKQYVNNVFHYEHFVGKGQYLEAQMCYYYDIPAFIYHYNQLDSNGNICLLVSKLTDKYREYKHSIFDENDWKTQYGVVNSHCVGKATINLFDFVDSIKSSTEIVVNQVKVYSNRNLLLLLC